MNQFSLAKGDAAVKRNVLGEEPKNDVFQMTAITIVPYPPISAGTATVSISGNLTQPLNVSELRSMTIY